MHTLVDSQLCNRYLHILPSKNSLFSEGKIYLTSSHLVGGIFLKACITRLSSIKAQMNLQNCIANYFLP